MKLLEFIDNDIIQIGSGSMDKPSHEHGTISLLRMGKSSADSIGEWCRQRGISCINEEDLHCTVLFSRNPVEHLSELNDTPIKVKARIKSWKKLGSALTLELESPLACKLHEWMRSEGGSHDYPEYIAHTTISYEWPQDELPDECPKMVLEFDRLVVKPINPKHASDSKSKIERT